MLINYDNFHFWGNYIYIFLNVKPLYLYQINNKKIEPIPTLRFSYKTVSSDVNDCAEAGVFSPFVQVV